MSIHKSQGQSKLHCPIASTKLTNQPSIESKSISEKCLKRVKVSLINLHVRVKADTLAYVALSRATTMEGLQVLGFSADKVRQLLLLYRSRKKLIRQVQAHKRVAIWSKDLKDLNDME